MAGYEQQHDYDAASGADEQEREARTGKVKTTTAELFVTARKAMGRYPMSNEDYDEDAAAERAISELESRMGAMERAMRMASDVLRRIGKSSAADPLTGQQCRDLLKTRETLDTALTDATPVFNLEEVRDAVIKAVSLVQGTGLAETIASDAAQHLAALRSTGGGR